MTDENLDRLVKALADSVEKSKDFVVEQAPDVVQQWVAWRMTECVFYTAIFVGLFLVCFILFRKCRRWGKSEYERMEKEGNKPTDTSAEVAACEVGALGQWLSSAWLIGVACNTHTLLQLWIAPKVAVIEWLMHIATKK